MVRSSLWLLFSMALCCHPVVGIAALDDDTSLSMSPLSHFEAGISLSIHAANGGLVLKSSEAGLYEHQGLFQSPVIEAPAPFDALFFSYGAKVPLGTEVTFLVRAWNGGEASRWYRVGREGEAMFERPAQAFQYRLTMTSNTPDTSPIVDAVSFVFELRAEHAPTEPTEPPANEPVPPSTSTTAPPIVERNDWQAREPNGSYSNHAPEYLIVHHTYYPTIADYTGAATVRGIQNYHMDERHWTDIGYHFLIGPDGVVYRGRPEEVVGAHCLPNRGKVGVSVIGNYMTEALTATSRDSLVRLLAYLANKHKISVEHIYGHQDFSSTLCPGTDIYDQLEQLRLDVASLLEK